MDDFDVKISANKLTDLIYQATMSTKYFNRLCAIDKLASDDKSAQPDMIAATLAEIKNIIRG